MIRCYACKASVTKAKGLKLKRNDKTHKGVCIPCYDRIMAYRTKRGYGRDFRPLKDYNKD